MSVNSATIVKQVATKELSSHAQATIFGLAAYAVAFAGVFASATLGVELANLSL